MIEGRLSEVAATLGGQAVGADAAYRGLSTDTRTLQPGELFVALDGPNYSGRSFVAAAAEKAAAGAIVNGITPEPLTQIDVADTRRALGDLAASWRRRMSARIVGLTGSNGKTTLKELIASCLSRTAKTLATEGNLNNDIGVPLMLSRLDEDHAFAVIEMGANHAGEIAYLTTLSTPGVVAITNAGPAHLEGFGSIDGVANAKGEILRGTPRPECAILNADDRYFDLWCSFAHDVPILSFGVEARAEVRIDALRAIDDGLAFDLILPADTLSIKLPLAGQHNALNAAAAAAVCVALDIDAEDIVAGLESVRPVGGRLEALQLTSRVTLFDDSYNANPASVVAAAQFLSLQRGERWLILGDMAELGADAAAMHDEVGRAARAAGVDRMFAVGPLSRHAQAGFGSGASWHASVEQLTQALVVALAEREDHTALLVKGSRSARMERVVAALQGELDQGNS